MPDESAARAALATCAQVPDLDRDTRTLLSPARLAQAIAARVTGVDLPPHLNPA